MPSVPLHQAKARLSTLVARARAGEDIVITRGRRPLVRLVPVDHPVPKRTFGALRGTLIIDETFFDPLPDAELTRWE